MEGTRKLELSGYILGGWARGEKGTPDEREALTRSE